MSDPAADRVRAPDASRRRNPWWIPPFLGRVPAVEERHLRPLGLVALALLFEQYDLSMVTAALRHIAEDIGMSSSEISGHLAVVRLGAVAAVLVVPLADLYGRRLLFLACVLGSSLGTVLTAFVQTPAEFVAVQMLTRIFLTAGQAVSFVIITEEFPADHRGWGIGILGALGATGVGLGALLFAGIDVLPFGWRSLYLVGVVPLLLLPLLRRGVPETARFQRLDRERTAQGAPERPVRAWLRTLLAFARTHPRRAALVAGIGGLDSAGKVAVFQFTAYHVLGRGWEPYQYSLLVVLGGAIGITGNVVAGNLGDRFGRRSVGFVVMAAFPLAAWLFYQGPGWAIPAAWIALAFFATAGQVIQRALAAELFPTSQRGTAVGWLTFVESLGAFGGLLLVQFGAGEAWDLPLSVAALSTVVALGGGLILLLPETSRRELEAISEEPGAR